MYHWGESFQACRFCPWAWSYWIVLADVIRCGYSTSEWWSSSYQDKYCFLPENTGISVIKCDLNVCSLYKTEYSIHLGFSPGGVKNPDNLCTDLIELVPCFQGQNETKAFQLWCQRKGKGSVSPVKNPLLGCAMDYIVKWQMSEPQWARASLNSLLKILLLATCKSGFLRGESFIESCWGTGESQEVPKEHMRYKKC